MLFYIYLFCTYETICFLLLIFHKTLSHIELARILNGHLSYSDECQTYSYHQVRECFLLKN